MLKLKIDERLYQAAMMVVLCIVAALIVATFRDYGITWDEELQSQYGQAVVDYYTSLFSDQRYHEIYNLYLYGGMFDGLASVFDRYAPLFIGGERLTVYDIRHFLNAVFGLLGMWGTWRLGRVIGGGVVGLMALVLLALTPMYYGHMFNNPKDIPFAAGIIWSMYYMARCLEALPKTRASLIIKLGIVLGFTLGIRVGGVMALTFFVFALALYAAKPWFAHNPWWERVLIWRHQRKLRDTIRNFWRVSWRLALPAAALSYFVMLACWPWAQQSPLWNPIHALSEFEHFPHDVEVLLNGTTYMSTALPWFYVPLYFAVQLPELLLFLAVMHFLLLPWIWRDLKSAQRPALVLIILMAFAPILYAVFGHPALYDAVRHFLFVVPIVCVLAAIAARRIFSWLWVFLDNRVWHARPIILGLAALAVAGLLGQQVQAMVLLHPYEYIYVNKFVGGVKGAYGRFELDYWGSSFKEAAEKLQAYVKQSGGIPPGKMYKVAICGPWDSAMIYLPPDYEPVEASQPADFFLSTTRWMCQKIRPGIPVIEIRRLGVPLSVVKDLRPLNEIQHIQRR